MSDYELYVKSDLWPTASGVAWEVHVPALDGFRDTGVSPTIDDAYAAITAAVEAAAGATVGEEILVERWRDGTNGPVIGGQIVRRHHPP